MARPSSVDVDQQTEASLPDSSHLLAPAASKASSAHSFKMSDQDFQKVCSLVMFCVWWYTPIVDVLAQCKDRLRPVKGSIRNLGKPREGLSEKEQLDLTEKCLLKIGDHINKSISEYKGRVELLKEWRWYDSRGHGASDVAAGFHASLVASRRSSHETLSPCL